jgi:hypothetical protein
MNRANFQQQQSEVVGPVVGSVLWDSSGNAVLSYGTATEMAAATGAGYAVAGIWQETTNAKTYINGGTVLIASWKLVTSA